MQRTKGQGDKMSNTIKQSKTRCKRIRTKYPKSDHERPVLKGFDLSLAATKPKEHTSPHYCKIHMFWYAPWIDECPICAGEKMEPASTKEK